MWSVVYVCVSVRYASICGCVSVGMVYVSVCVSVCVWFIVCVHVLRVCIVCAPGVCVCVCLCECMCVSVSDLCARMCEGLRVVALRVCMWVFWCFVVYVGKCACVYLSVSVLVYMKVCVYVRV